MPDVKQIALSINYSADLKFAWQMFFNRFTVEEDGTGKIVSFASVHDGGAKEIVPVRFSRDSLLQCRRAVEPYLPGLLDSGDAPADTEKLPTGVKRFSTLFSNHIRLSRSGDVAEFALYTIPISLLADEIKGKRKKGDMPVIPVAILHSSVAIHLLLINRLLDNVPLTDADDPSDP